MNQVIEIQFDLTIIIALLLFSAISILILIIYVWSRTRHGSLIVHFILGQAFIGIWTILYIFELLAPDFETRWKIVVVEFVCISIIPPLFLIFSRVFFGSAYQHRYPTRWTQIPYQRLFPRFQVSTIFVLCQTHEFYGRSQLTLQN